MGLFQGQRIVPATKYGLVILVKEIRCLTKQLNPVTNCLWTKHMGFQCQASKPGEHSPEVVDHKITLCGTKCSQITELYGVQILGRWGEWKRFKYGDGNTEIYPKVLKIRQNSDPSVWQWNIGSQSFLAHLASEPMVYTGFMYVVYKLTFDQISNFIHISLLS